MTLPQPRRLPVQARARATFEAILEASARVLVERGYDAASTNRVAEVAGVSIGTLYQYFPNKEALFVALIERHFDEQVELLQRMVGSLIDAPLAEAVRAYVGALFEAHANDKAFHDAILQQVTHLGLPAITRVHMVSRQIVQVYLEAHRERLRITDTALAAFVLVSAVEGIVHTLMFAPERPELDALSDEVSLMVLRYLVGGDDAG